MVAIGAFADFADDLEALGQARDAVAVAHPHRVFLALRPDAVKERALRDRLDIGAAEFAVVAGLDLAAELFGEKLLAIADAEDRHAGVEDRLEARGASLRR